jgi:uncharacterized protein (TIGR03435 family)
MIRPFAYIGLAALLSVRVFGQAPDAKPAFEIADVHPSPHSMQPFMQGGFLHGDRYVLKQATMVDLISTAYSVEADNVQGGPNWLELDRFDIIAKAPPATPQATLKLMLQTLLADRFKLMVHNDTKPMDAFVLSEGSGKPKLKEADGSGAPECQQQIGPPPEPGKVAYITASCHNITMEAFATRVHQMAGGYLTSPVVDTTNIKGAWDFDIKWTGRGALAQAGDDGISIFDAIDKQLGLKLKLSKYPMPVLAVDSANEKPTDNPPEVKKTLPPPPPAEFEVAALKPSAPDAKSGGRGFQPGGRIDFIAVPLSALIGAAWNFNVFPGDEIVGAPKWVNSAKYDLVAKAYASAPTATGPPQSNGAPDIDIDDLRLMLRALLVDRLKIVTHYEDRPQAAYTLVAVKPKLKKADPTNRTGCKVGAAPLEKDAKPGPVPLQAACRNMTMAQFAEQLTTIAALYIRNPVIDASGLEGAWDFTLTFNPVPPNMNLGGGGEQERKDGGGRGGAPPPPGAAGGAAPEIADPSTVVSLFEAVERQLGMKLEMHKRPLPVLVIDHIEEKPDN